MMLDIGPSIACTRLTSPGMNTTSQDSLIVSLLEILVSIASWNTSTKYIPKYFMFRVHALRSIPAGTVLCVGTVIPNRYHVRRNCVLENFSDSLSSRVAKQIAAGKITSADRTTLDLSLS
jgi:hypothetical protein